MEQDVIDITAGKLPPPGQPPEPQTPVFALYGLLGAGVLLLFVPFLPAIVMGAFMLPLTLFTGWCLRLGKTPESLTYQHAIYIARTVWAWSFISGAATAIAGFLVFTKADNSLYDRIIGEMMQGVHYSPAMMSEALAGYIQTNFALMVTAGIICFVPIVGYIVWRFCHGLRRALKGEPPRRPFSWF